MSVLDDVVCETREFARVREWFADHSTKNPSMAVASEAGGLLAEFRWRTDEESSPEGLTPPRRATIRREMADDVIFLLRRSEVLDVDLAAAAQERILLNESRVEVSEKTP